MIELVVGQGFPTPEAEVYFRHAALDTLGDKSMNMEPDIMEIQRSNGNAVPVAAPQAGWFPKWEHLLLLGLLTLLLFSQAYHGAVNPESPITGWDFQVFYQASGRLNHGERLYVETGSAEGRKPPYVYSPLLAELLRPVARLPLGGAIKVWFFVSAVCLVLSAAAYAFSVPITLEEVPALCIILIVSFRFWPTVFNFGLGQANTPLLLSACAMYWAESRGKSRLAGCMIALGALVKPWMIGLLIYPLIRRNWRAALWTIGFYCVAVLALFAPMGRGAWLDYCHVTAANASQTFLLSQSIAGFARLHFAANPHLHPLIVSRAAFYGFILLGYSTVGATFLYLWSRKKPATGYEERLWFGLALLSLPLVSPLCHDEYYILALPLFWTLLTLPAADPRRIHPRLSWGALILYLLFTHPWPTSGDGLAAHQSGLGSLLVSAYFILAALLWMVGIYAVFKARGAALRA